MKKKILLFFIFFIQVNFFLFAQDNSDIVPGVIRVKLTREAVRFIEHKTRGSGKIIASSAQPFSAGLSHFFDNLCRHYKAVEMKRVFPYNKKFEKRHKEAGLDLWYEIKVDKQIQTLVASKSLRFDKSIAFAEPVLKTKINADPPVNDPLLEEQWAYDNKGQTGGTAGVDINLFAAWKRTMGSDKITVAVIDGGIDITHDDLKNALWVNEMELNGTPGVDNDGNGYIDDLNGWNFVNNSAGIIAHSHGTHVAGIIGAENNNGIGVAGVAGGNGKERGVRLMSCQVFTDKDEGDFAAAFVYAADNGAVIAQNSWGYKNPGLFEQVVLDAIDYFIKNAGKDENGNPLPGTKMSGGIVFFAAGNENANGLYWPGCYNRVYAVSALSQNNIKAWYSNFASWVDIAAPGGNHDSKGGILSTGLNNSYVRMSGTSMACPHISGVAALVLSVFGSEQYTPDRLWNRLLHATKNIDHLNPEYKGLLGKGIIDASLALELEEQMPLYKPGDILIAYPNPVVDILMIRPAADITGAMSVTITDMSGRICLTKNYAAGLKTIGELNLSALSKGVYIFTAIANGKKKAFKLLKG